MNTRKWRWTLALAVTISVAGNVGYALMTATPAHAVIAALAAAVAPTMLFLITHNLAADRDGGGGWRQRASLAGAWAITVAAFAASYIELHALMLLLGRSPASAILSPLIVDVAIAVASLRVLVSDEPAPSRTRAPSPWRRLSDAAVARAEAALMVPQSVQVETVVEVREGVHEAPVRASVEGSAKPHGGVREVVREPVHGGSAKGPAKSRGGSGKGSAEPSVDPALAPFMETAQRLAEGKVVRGKTATDYAAILAAVDRGDTPSRIRTVLGVSHETTAKVVEAASGEGRPALTVV